MAQCFAYLSDVTNDKNRLLRIAVFQALSYVVTALGQLTVGFLIRDYGFKPPLWMMNIGLSIALLYMVIPGLIIETVDSNKSRVKNQNGTFLQRSKSNVKAGLKDLSNLFKINVKLRRWRLGLLYLIDFMRELLEKSAPVVIVYGLGPPFCWTSLNVSTYWIIILSGTALGRWHIFLCHIYEKHTNGKDNINPDRKV